MQPLSQLGRNDDLIHPLQGFPNGSQPENDSEKLEVMLLTAERLHRRICNLIDLHRQYPSSSRNSLFFLSTSSLYSEVSLPLSESHLVVTGLVHKDGVGDYYHMLHVAEFIKQKFPNLKVSMIVFYISDKHLNTVRKPDEAKIETCFLECELWTDNIKSILNKSDQIISMSQENYLNGDLKKFVEKMDKYRHIGEYGISYQSMGLGDGQLGIIFKDKPPTSSIIDINNKWLKQVLFGTKTPSEADLQKYYKMHEPFIAYLKKGSYYQMGLIYTAAAYLKSSDKQTTDLIIPSVPMEILNTQFLQEQGIATIKVIKIEKDELIETEITLASEGKELRLINPFPLDQGDLHTLLAHTNLLTGCAGDQSFTEVISFDRLPFFEHHRWKLEFHKQLIELAGCVGSEPHYLRQYFQELYNIYDDDQKDVINGHEELIKAMTQKDFVFERAWSSSSSEEIKAAYISRFETIKAKQHQIAASALKIAELLRQPELFEELHAFIELLKSQYAFNPTLQNIVERQLALNGHPQLQQAEKEIQKEYLEGRITLLIAIKQLADRIHSL